MASCVRVRPPAAAPPPRPLRRRQRRRRSQTSPARRGLRGERSHRSFPPRLCVADGRTGSRRRGRGGGGEGKVRQVARVWRGAGSTQAHEGVRGIGNENRPGGSFGKRGRIRGGLAPPRGRVRRALGARLRAAAARRRARPRPLPRLWHAAAPGRSDRRATRAPSYRPCQRPPARETRTCPRSVCAACSCASARGQQSRAGQEVKHETAGLSFSENGGFFT